MSEYDPGPCAYCKELIEKGALRHSLIPEMHYRCAIEALAGIPPEQVDSVRLRMKVWTDPADGKRWLLAGVMTTPLGMAIGKKLTGHAMRDAEVKLVALTHEEYNALPYSVFVETDRNVKSPGVRNQELVSL